MASTASFGLYLGNTSACLAIYRDDNVDVVANDAGDRVTPAVVAFNDAEKVVGHAAKAGLFRNGPTSVLYNKRLMNKDIDPMELEQATASSPSKLVNESGELKFVIKRGEKNEKISPAEITTMIFEAMHGISTTAAHDDEEYKVVLCVPLRFSSASIRMWSEAAEAAGLQVLQVIGEPAAACLAHGVGQDKKKTELVLVYRVGGVTSDVTLIRVVGGAYRVLSSRYYPDLGGSKLTRILAEYLAGEFMNKWKLDPTESRRSMSKMNSAAETCKHVLSTMSSAHCFVESLCEGVDFSYNLSRARFENLIGSTIADYVEPIQDILRSTGHEAGDIGKIILCGGTMKIPKLQERIASLFPNGEILSGKWSPDETMAIGAARQSALLIAHGLNDRELNSRSAEVNSLRKPLCVQFGDVEPIVIPSETIVPIKIQTIVEVPEVENGKVNVKIFEKEDMTTTDSKKIGLISLSAERGDKLKVDTDLTETSLNVNVTEMKTGKKSSFRFGILEDDF